jgi:K+-transporting ATPase ATPase A chain
MEIIMAVVTVAVMFALAVPLGSWLYKIISGESTIADRVFDKTDGIIYTVCGIKRSEDMSWKKYFLSLVLLNGILFLLLFVMLMFQGFLPLNPNRATNMPPYLAFNTAASFITNTDWQSYSGENVSYLTQMLLTAFMFIAPASGLAAAAAFLRGVTGSCALGNFYADVVRFITRLLLPLSIICAVILLACGCPQTLAGDKVVTTIEGARQVLALGPVASLEAVKNLASNGGGFFNANSAHPFENPNGISNFLSLVSLGLISTSTVFAFGKMTRSKKQARVLFIVMSALLVFSIAVSFAAEYSGNSAVSSAGIAGHFANTEGKETRIGVGGTALFSAMTTAFQVGAVNGSQASLTPMGAFAAMWNMILQTVFGGKGTGFIYVVMYAIITVFICGLMVGRTPEYLGKKIEVGEIKMVSVGILAHPLFTLVPLALAVLLPALSGAASSAGFQGISQMLYACLSSSANNGSAFSGLDASTPFWTITLGISMLLGRYVPLCAMLCAAGSLSAKKAVTATSGTFRTDSPVFGITLLFIIIVIGALSFFPALVLGPVAQQLTL